MLDFVARQNGTTFTDICKSTGLPKSVVHRILAELVSSGYVWRGLAEPIYFASSSLAIVPKGAKSQVLKRAALAPLERLVVEVQWPSDLFVREGSDMILVDTTRPKSPFALKWSRIGRRVPILLSSVGRAVLASMSEEQRDEVFADLRRRGDWKRQLRRCSAPLDKVLDETRSRGFGTREPEFYGEEKERHGIFSIAVPIIANNEVIGALNIWWPISADRGKRFQGRFLKPLIQAAEAIGENIVAATDPERRRELGKKAGLSSRARLGSSKRKMAQRSQKT